MSNEILGIASTILLVISMAISTKDNIKTLIMRIINAISCLGFIMYSINLLAYSTVLSNSIILILDIYYIVKNIYYIRKEHNSGKV